MDTLFDISEFEVITPVEKKPADKKPVKEKSVEIKIVAPKNKSMSKVQQSFNRLSKRVVDLQSEIQSEKVKLDKLQKAYSDKIPSLEKDIAGNQIKIAKTISLSTQTFKFGKRQLEKVGSVIENLCNQAFEYIEPDQETEALYDKWVDNSYQEEKDSQLFDMKKMMEDMLHSKFGKSFDMSDLDDSPESFDRFQKKLQDECENQNKKQEEADAAHHSKKSKKTLEKELRQKEEETMMLKSLRSIYISLVKVLHPDTETDPVEKLRKEELMKMVTVAYDEKDLTALLKMEIEWVNAECHNLDTMTDEKLKLYISALKAQVGELEDEKESLYYHTRYNDISNIARYPESSAAAQIKSQINRLKKQKSGLNVLITQFSQFNTKTFVMDFVNQAYEIMDEEEDDDLWESLNFGSFM